MKNPFIFVFDLIQFNFLIVAHCMKQSAILFIYYLETEI